MRIFPSFFLLLSVAACGGAPTDTAPSGSTADLDAAVAALAARAEHDAAEVQVQHVLISFEGAPRMTGVTRSLEDAHALAAEVHARALAGEDFNALMKEFSNDSGPGIYRMTKASRGNMVKGFGDVSWRLEVDEIGVAPHDSEASYFGWHIIKRLR